MARLLTLHTHLPCYQLPTTIRTTVLADLAKAYEEVRLNLLWLLAVGTGMPQVVVMLAVENYYCALTQLALRAHGPSEASLSAPSLSPGSLS